jgi:hypothetical protein
MTPLQIATESSAVPKSERKTTVGGGRTAQPVTRSASSSTRLQRVTAGPYSTAARRIIAMDDLEQTVADLARRVRALEDELAIHRQIVRYGLAVDVGDADAAAALVTEDTVYDVDGPLLMEADATCARGRRPTPPGDAPNCAHQIGPAVVEVDGDRATAVGYSRVYLRRDGAIGIYRVSFNRWELERRAGEWLIARRTTRLLGHEEARRIFRPA